MATLAELQTQRTAAGATYVAAVAALKAAYIDLASLDRTIANANVNGGKQPGFHNDRLEVVDALHVLEHVTYLPTVYADWESLIVGSLVTRLANFPTPGA